MKNLLLRLHPFDAIDQALTHDVRRLVSSSSMAGQDPLEIEVQKTRHGFRLFSPRVPGHVAKCDQPAAIVRPREMIACEEEFVVVENHNVASRMSRDGDGEEVLVEADGVAAIQ